MEIRQINKQLQIIEEFRSKLDDFDDLEFDIAADLECAIDSASEFYRKLLESIENSDYIDYQELRNKFNYENYPRRLIG